MSILFRICRSEGVEPTVVPLFSPSRFNVFPPGTVSADSTIVEQAVFDTLTASHPSVPLKVHESFALLMIASLRSGAAAGAGAGFAKTLATAKVPISVDKRCNMLRI